MKKRFQLYNPRGGEDTQHDDWRVIDTKENKEVKHGLGGVWSNYHKQALDFKRNLNRLNNITGGGNNEIY